MNFMRMLKKQYFCLENVCDDDKKVKFHIGFASYLALMVCFNLFGSAVDKLVYRSSSKSKQKSNKGRQRVLSPVNEFFLL